MIVFSFFDISFRVFAAFSEKRINLLTNQMKIQKEIQIYFTYLHMAKNGKKRPADGAGVTDAHVGE